MNISQETIEIYMLFNGQGKSFGKIENNNPNSIISFLDCFEEPTASIVIAIETGTHST